MPTVPPQSSDGTSTPPSVPRRRTTATRRTRDLATTVRRALTADFRRHGRAAIEAIREKDPAAYLKLCASLLPAADAAEPTGADPLDDLTSEQLHDFAAKLDRFLVYADRAGAGPANPRAAEPDGNAA